MAQSKEGGTGDIWHRTHTEFSALPTASSRLFPSRESHRAEAAELELPRMREWNNLGIPHTPVPCTSSPCTGPVSPSWRPSGVSALPPWTGCEDRHWDHCIPVCRGNLFSRQRFSLHFLLSLKPRRNRAGTGAAWCCPMPLKRPCCLL